MNKQTVLVVAAHPDDEVLGCGGTIYKHHLAGDKVYLITLTNGVSARDNHDSDDTVIRNEALEKSCKTLGVDEYHCLSFPDNQMDTISLLSITKEIEKFAKDKKISTVYTHSLKDLNIDHQITHKATLTAFRPQPGLSVKRILAFEVLSSTEWSSDFFTPNYFVTLSDDCWNKKMEAMKYYSEELREFPHSRSIRNIENIGSLRGACIGYTKAEAFELIRSID
ncbi:MAG: GlcNAc-PI de-N-acetylase [Pseudomonas sp.]|nr:GlcNAc-PI de-N-acetylase [Pseudomonas sp.]